MLRRVAQAARAFAPAMGHGTSTAASREPATAAAAAFWPGVQQTFGAAQVQPHRWYSPQNTGDADNGHKFPTFAERLVCVEVTQTFMQKEAKELKDVLGKLEQQMASVVAGTTPYQQRQEQKLGNVEQKLGKVEQKLERLVSWRSNITAVGATLAAVASTGLAAAGVYSKLFT